VRDHGKLYLRTATVLAPEPESLRVILSEPLDKSFVEQIAGDLGRIAVYGTESQTANSPASSASQQDDSKSFLTFDYGTLRERIFIAGRFRQRAMRSTERSL